MPDFWEVPDGFDGTRPDSGDLPGALHALPGGSRLKTKSDSGKVWAFLGDGETDEPESLGAITLAVAREARQPDLRDQLQPAAARRPGARQRQDHSGTRSRSSAAPAGTSSRSSGAATGISCSRRIATACWSSAWAKSSTASIQKYAVESGAYFRAALLRHRSAAARDGQASVRRAADEACAGRPRSRSRSTPPTRPPSSTKGAPTVILAKTIKGYGLGEAGEGKNITHQQKKLNEDELRDVPHRASASRFRTTRLHDAPFYRPPDDSPEIRYLQERPRSARRLRARAQGPRRSRLPPVSASLFEEFHKGTDGRKVSTTMVFVRLLSKLLRDKDIGKLVVPIVPDEARTFGMEALFRQVRHLLARRPAVRAGRHGHAALLQGSQGRADSRRRHHRSRLDVVVHRRRHGVRDARRQHDSVLHLLLDVRLPAHRRSDLGRRRSAHARLPARRHRRPHDAGRRRPAAPGRPQPPARARRCRTCSPTIRRSPTRSPSIIEDGIRRMYVDQESIFYYLTVMNEQYAMPAMPEGDARTASCRGCTASARRRSPTPSCARSSSAAARSCPR